MATGPRCFHGVPATGTIAPIATVFIDAVGGVQVTEVLIEEGAWSRRAACLVDCSDPLAGC